MVSSLNSGSLRGPGMIALQVLRALTLISLAAAGAACWVLIVKIDTTNGFFFFDAASLFFTSTVAVFLGISELPIARSYFGHTWPVLSDDHGLTWLGLAMNIIGCNILGKLNQPANDADDIGLPFWRLVLAAGILNITFGILNIILSLIFHDGKNGINARHVRTQGSLAASSKNTYSDEYSVRSNSVKNEKGRNKFMSMLWTKGPAGKTSEKPQISHPMPAHHDVERDAEANNNDDDWENDRLSPIVPGVRRPDTALHPMHTGASSRYSKYSTAHMSRF